MAEAGDGSAHTPLTPEWTPAPRASHYPWQGDRPAAAPSHVMMLLDTCFKSQDVVVHLVYSSIINVHRPMLQYSQAG